MDSENQDQTERLTSHADLSLLGTQFIFIVMFWSQYFAKSSQTVLQFI